MKVTILCSAEKHPVNGMLSQWIAEHERDHEIRLVRSSDELPGGDILFLVSCSEVIGEQQRNRYAKTLVIHASDLPRGRGWSPHIWAILKGTGTLTVSLLEAEDAVDSGAIWKKLVVDVPRHALYDEINDILFRAEAQLMDFAIEAFADIQPIPQDPSIAPTFHPKRQPGDSVLDATKTIAEQFDLLRVCDPQRYPAFFHLHGHRYKVTIEKIDDE